MESNREQPTDDASMGIGEPEPLSEVYTSDSLTTLKDGLTQEQMGVELTSDDIHLGFMVEKGLIEYDSLDKPTDEDDADCGDYRRRLTVDSAVSGHIEELVKEMRSEFMHKALSKAKNLKSTLIKRGIMCGGYKRLQSVKEKQSETQFEDQSEHQSGHQSGLQSEPQSEPPSETQPALSSDLQEDIQTEATQETLAEEESTKEFVSKEDEINQLVLKINEFTTSMEEVDPDSADWEQFRGSLSKVCQIYQPPKEQEDTEVSEDTNTETDTSEPLQYLNSRVKELRQKISGMECKMVSLDQNIEVFCDKFDSSKIGRERAERDMAILQCMHERIGRRLAQMEVDLQQSRQCLLSKTKTVLDEMKRGFACADGDHLSPFPQSS